MAPRATLQYSATDVAGNVFPFTSITLCEPDGTTLLQQPVYDVAAGGVPVGTTVTTNSLGYLQLWAEVEQPIVIVRAGLPYDSEFTRDLRHPRPWVDAAVLGARPSNTAAKNTAAINAAIAACIAAGGGKVYLREGVYHINAALNILPLSSSIAVEFYGDGPDSTTIIQDTPGLNVITVGQNGGGSLNQHVHINRLSLSGGSAGISLNNTIAASLDHVWFSGHRYGLLGIGQNEHLLARNLIIQGCTDRGILMGASNGSLIEVASGGDDPELQKSVFDKILISGVSGGTALEITAGTINAFGSTVGVDPPGQLTSGDNIFRHIQLEGNVQSQVVLGYCFNTTLEHVSNESTVLTNTNTYSIFQMGVGCADVTLRNSRLAPLSHDAKTFKYAVEVKEGLLLLENTVTSVGGAAGTKDIFTASGARIRVKDSVVSTGANNVLLTTPGACRLDNVMDGGFAPITNWPDGYVWSAPSTTGLRMGRLGIGRDPATYPFEVNGSAQLKSAASDLSFTMDGGTNVSQLVRSFNRSGAAFWIERLSGDTNGDWLLTDGSGNIAVTIVRSTRNVQVQASLQVSSAGLPVTKILSNVTPNWTPGTIASLGQSTAVATVTGARKGDSVSPGYSQNINGALVLTGVVTADDTVTLSLYNPTGGGISVTAGVGRATVISFA